MKKAKTIGIVLVLALMVAGISLFIQARIKSQEAAKIPVFTSKEKAVAGLLKQMKTESKNLLACYDYNEFTLVLGVKQKPKEEGEDLLLWSSVITQKKEDRFETGQIAMIQFYYGSKKRLMGVSGGKEISAKEKIRYMVGGEADILSAAKDPNQREIVKGSATLYGQKIHYMMAVQLEQ